MMKRCVLLTMLSWVLFGCAAPAKIQVLEDGYAPASKYMASLLVMPLNSDLIKQAQFAGKNNGKAAHHTLVGKDKAFLYRYLGAVFSDVTTASVFGIDARHKPDVQFEEKRLPLSSKATLDIWGPRAGQLTFEDQTPDFVLFLEDVYFDLNYEESRRGVGSGTREQYTLDAGMEYLLWDNRKASVCGYGKLAKTFNLIALPTKENYLTILESFARSIVQKSPLVIKQAIF